MKVLVTGASGYIGGAIAMRLLEAGHGVVGLVRSEKNVEPLHRLGIVTVVGTLDDAALLTSEARKADAVINAANSDHRGAAEALIEGLVGSGKPFLHTSGSSIVADDARGEPSDRVYTEDALPEPVPEKAPRVALDRLVVSAANREVRSAVVCNTLIYGRGKGLNPDSMQVPALVRQARKSEVVRHVGRGLNVWSTVHIDDVADLYVLALERAPEGAFYFAENGEASFREMSIAIAEVLGLGEPQSWPVEDAVREWGYQQAMFGLGSNSRVRGQRARQQLGWAPRHGSVFDWIGSGMQ